MNTIRSVETPSVSITERLPARSRLFLAMLGIGSVGIAAYLPVMVPYGLSSTLIAVMVGLLVFGAVVGTAFAASVGLRAPLIEGTLTRQIDLEQAVRSLVPMAALGVLVGAIVFGFQLLVTRPLYAAATGGDIWAGNGEVPLYLELLGAPLYGGLTEEIIWRFGVMTLFVVVFAKLAGTYTKGITPSAAVMWAAIIATTIPFALEHVLFLGTVTLPAVFLAAYLGPLVGIGILEGWLYWKRGLESAMVVHLVASVASITLIAVLL